MNDNIASRMKHLSDIEHQMISNGILSVEEPPAAIVLPRVPEAHPLNPEDGFHKTTLHSRLQGEWRASAETMADLTALFQNIDALLPQHLASDTFEYQFNSTATTDSTTGNPQRDLYIDFLATPARTEPIDGMLIVPLVSGTIEIYLDDATENVIGIGEASITAPDYGLFETLVRT